MDCAILEFQPLSSYQCGMASYGGYEYEFCNGDDDGKYTCNVCVKVLKDPHLTSCCGQHFCESCLSFWFGKGQKVCPHCRARGAKFRHFLDKSFKREIEILLVVCSNKDKGCSWKGELSSVQSHFSSSAGCDYVKVECPNQCPSVFDIVPRRILRKNLTNHLENECYLRPYKCEYCELKDTYQAITGDGIDVWDSQRRGHYAVCPKYPLKCPNKCSSDDILRKDMEDHRKKCPKEVVCCAFEEAGCQVKVIRSDLDRHMKDSQFEHMSLIMADYKQTKTDLKLMQETMEEMKIALTEKKTELLDVQEEMEGLREEQMNLCGDLSYLRVEVHLMKKDTDILLPQESPERVREKWQLSDEPGSDCRKSESSWKSDSDWKPRRGGKRRGRGRGYGRGSFRGGRHKPQDRD